MRIVLVSGIFPPDIGGPATHTDDLRRELGERGHAVTVLTLWDGPCVSHRPGIVRFPRRWTWPMRHAAVASWLIRHRHRYDSVYATGMLPAAVAGARLAGRPVVVKVVGDPVWERGRREGLTEQAFERFQEAPSGRGRLGAMRRLRDWSLRRSDAITAPSQYLADVVEHWLGGPADVTVIPNGVRVPLEDVTRRTEDGGLRLVYVGRLVAHKQVDHILRAVASTSGVHLEVVGTGPEGNALGRLADDLDVRERVTFSGDRSHAAVLRSMAAAHALVLASDYEGLPHVVLEALAAGTPVVSPSVGGVAEVVEDGTSGLLLADAQASTIASTLTTLRDDPDLRERLAAGARLAGRSFSMERTAGAVAELAAARVRQPRPVLVTIGRSRWPDRVPPDLARKLATLVRHVEPVFVQSGTAGLRRVGRARAVVFPSSWPGTSALFYSAAPAVATALTAGRRRAAIVCQSPYEGAGTVALTRLLPPSLRPRVVIEVHGDWRTATRLYGSRWRGVVAPAADRVASWAVRRADRVRVVAEAGERFVREAGYRGPIDRYPAFVDIESFASSTPVPPPDAPVVLFAGAFERYKGVDVLIEAWASVVEQMPDAHLILAGEGPLRSAVEVRAAELGLVSATSFLGHVANERIASLMDASRVVVLPSRSEGLPRVILEAFSRERPVVATEVGGVGELVVDGATGWLLPANDASALAAALAAALIDPVEAARRARQGRELLAGHDPVAAYERGVHALAGWIG